MRGVSSLSIAVLAMLAPPTVVAATCGLLPEGGAGGQTTVDPNFPIIQLPVDFSNVRGLNYIASYAPSDVAMWRFYDHDTIDRELEYVKGLGANSVRVWLAWVVYDVERDRFVDKFRRFLSLCEKHGLTVMPILWDSCFGDEAAGYDDVTDWVANPGRRRVADPAFRSESDEYVRAVVEAGRASPSLLAWDVMNEPSGEGVRSWLEHYCRLVRSLDPKHPVTIGWAHAASNEASAEWVDVMSYHPYGIFDKNRQLWTTQVREVASRHPGKPILATEAGAPGWGQRYEECIDFFQRERIGFYLFEAMIGTDRFRNMQGFFYPDGTIRDVEGVQAFQECARRQGATGLTQYAVSRRPLPYPVAGARQVAQMMSDWDSLELTPENFTQHEALLRWTLISLAWGGALGDHMQQVQAWKLEADAARKAGDMEKVKEATAKMAGLAARLLVEEGFVETTDGN